MFEVTHLLRQDAAPNVLAVLVRVPTNPIANHASPTYISSAGWDWMPYVPGLLGGITDDVYFTTSGDVSLVDPWVRTRVPSREQGVISLTTELKNHSQQEKTGVVRGVIRPGDITFEKRFKIGAGQQRTVGVDPREFPQLTVDDPVVAQRVWRPKPLYVRADVRGRRRGFRPPDGDIRHPGVFLRFREGRVPALGQRRAHLLQGR